MNAIEIGKRIAIARINQGIRSGAALGRRIGVSTKTVKSWENGANIPHSSRLAALARELNVGVNWILSGDTENSTKACEGSHA